MNQSHKIKKKHLKPTVSKALLHVLAKLSEKRGIHFDKICEAAGVRAAVLSKSDERISAEQFLRTWDLAEQAAEDKNFGLHFGSELAGNYLGGNILINLMANSATIGNVLKIFCKYHLLMEDAVLPKMAIDDHAVVIWWELFIPGVAIPRQYAEAVLCASTEILRAVSENHLNPETVSFTHSPPDDIREHEVIFRTRLLFDQPENALTISRENFDRPILLASRELFDALEPFAEKRLHQMYFPGSWSDKVRQEVYSLLSRGEIPNIETIAVNLASGSRTLQMKLRREDTTFTQLLDQIRKKTALAYLNDPEVSICDIALLLGFSEQSAFNHAFKRWTGTTPGKYKKDGVGQDN
ncbi:MAG: AraC family transcriptional regulator [Desulfobacteraceae bacterium]|nr:MAG: AraC family transcriptional regulator [Desulfobacteraceae bacterium]